MFPDKIFLG